MKHCLIAALAALALGTTAAEAVTITGTGTVIESQTPTTGMALGPNGGIWIGLGRQDRNYPNYETRRLQGVQDWPFAVIGTSNSLIHYNPILGDTHPGNSVVSGTDGAVYTLLQRSVAGINPEPATIARATSSGITDLFRIRPQGFYISALAADPDGGIWYSLREATSGGMLGKLTSDGQFTEFNVGFTALNTGKGSMVEAANGHVWMISGNRLIDVNPVDQTVNVIQLPNAPGTQLPVSPSSITAGPDGNIWYLAASDSTSVLGKVTPQGVVSSWAVGGYGGAVTAGPDGNVWFTAIEVSTPNDNGVNYNLVTGHAYRVDTNGTLTEYTVFTSDSRQGEAWTDIRMDSILTGADGKIYLMRYNENRNSHYAYRVSKLEFYALTPDAPTTSADPSITVLTTGNGSGSVKMSIGRNPNNSQQLMTLTAITNTGSTFGGWSDNACRGLNTTCQIVLSGNKTITASFTVPRDVMTTAYQGAAFSTNSRRSYLRFYAKNQTGTVYVNLINPQTGLTIGSPREVIVAGGGMVQVGVDELVPTGMTERPDYFTLSLQANYQFDGYFQHVLWDPIVGVVSNMTSCNAPATLPTFSFVYGSATGGEAYASSIVLTNTTSQNVSSVTLDIFDRNGTQLGTYVTDVIVAKGSRVIQVTDLEQQSGIVPDPMGFPMYAVKPRASFGGTIQHLFTNQQAGGIITDQTIACPLSGQ